jgi:hypothetical protein
VGVPESAIFAQAVDGGHRVADGGVAETFFVADDEELFFCLGG